MSDKLKAILILAAVVAIPGIFDAPEYHSTAPSATALRSNLAGQYSSAKVVRLAGVQK